MKTTIQFIITLLFCCCLNAQNGINYKAVIKNDLGNVIANSNVDIKFQILESDALTNVYEETHSTTTDDNGIIIVNIGDGSIISGIFDAINWGEDNHYLNVKIDTGSGFIDLGTTQFMNVPYALSALKSSDNHWTKNGDNISNKNLGKIGFNVTSPKAMFHFKSNEIFLIGNDTIGGGDKLMWLPHLHAFRVGTLATNGVSPSYWNGENIGTYSFASGYDTRAQGHASTAMGHSTQASNTYTFATGNYSRATGRYSTAMGFNTSALADGSTSLGYDTEAASFAEVAIGIYNSSYSPSSQIQWNSNDRLFVIGNGTSVSNKRNALTMLKNGNTGLVTTNPLAKLHISEGNDTGLGNNNGFLLLGETNGDNISIDNNEIMARNNGNTADLNLQIEGGNVKIGGPIYIGDETIVDGGNNALRINASLIPDVDNSSVLGNPSQRWSTVYATNGTINTSDRREKKNIKHLNYGLTEILQMNPVSFNWKDGTDQDAKLGLIAQDLLVLVPEVVKTHTWERDEVTEELTKYELDRMGVYYSDLIPVLINAIKEQQKIIDTQKKDISELKKETLKTSKNNYEALLSRIEQLEANTSN